MPNRLTICCMLALTALTALVGCVGEPPEPNAENPIPSSSATNPESSDVKQVAAVVTEYRHNSHADIIVSRLLQTYTLDGKGERSPLHLLSLYTDQVPDADTSRMLSASHSFPIHDNIADILL